MIRSLVLLALAASAPPAVPPGQGIPDNAFPVLQVCAPVAPQDDPEALDAQGEPVTDDT